MMMMTVILIIDLCMTVLSLRNYIFQVAILASSPIACQPASGAARREKDPRDALPLIAAQSLEQLLQLARTERRISMMFKDVPVPRKADLVDDMRDEDMESMEGSMMTGQLSVVDCAVCNLHSGMTTTEKQK